MVPHHLVGDIAIGKDNFINRMFPDEFRQSLLRHNGYTCWIARTGQGGRVGFRLNTRDLCRCESNNSSAGIVAEYHIKVMKIPTACTHYDHALLLVVSMHLSSLRPKEYPAK